MTEIKQPKIRFKGFTDDWEQRKLSDVSERICVGFVGTCEQYYTDSTGIPMYRTGNLNGLYLNKEDLKYVTQEFHNKNMKSQLKRGDILIARHGDSGKAVIYNYSDEANCLNIVIIRPNSNECDYRFLAQCINSPIPSKQIKGLSAGSTQSVINTKEIEKLAVSVPRNVEEQKVLANFFFNLDNVIALHQQKLEVTKQFKKTMLKKMFPKNGETTPEIRFKGFTGDWEECKLGDFLYEVSKRGNSDLEFITVREFDTILRPQSNQGYGNIVTDSKKLKAKIVLNGQFLIDLTSYSRGIYLSRLDGLTSNTYSVLELSEFGNLEFFTEFLKHPLFVSKLESLTPIGARQGKKIDQNSLLKSKFRMPHKEEQEVIGNYFKELDIQINSLEKKLFDMNLYKKTMLKKMFL